MTDNRRFFIISPGRTGSSLLASVLNDAGANFDMPDIDTWDPLGGAYEHPTLGAIVRQFEYTRSISARRPHALLARLRWNWSQHWAKSGLKALLPNVQVLKGEISLLVHWSARLGYKPTVIVSYRRFGEVLLGLGHLHPQLPSYHAEKYVATLRDGLALASIYGGCVIDYRELVDSGDTNWASALAQATGFEEMALLTARAKRINHPVGTDAHVIEPFPDCQAVYETLRELKGVVLTTPDATRRAEIANSAAKS